MGPLHHNLEVIDFFRRRRGLMRSLPANLTFSFASTNILDFDCVPIGETSDNLSKADKCQCQAISPIKCVP